MIGLPLLLLLAAQTDLQPQDAAAEMQAEDGAAQAEASKEPEKVWVTDVGSGLRRNSHSFEFKVSRAFGTTLTGSNDKHDLVLAQAQFGLILANVMEPNYWFGGNLEGLGVLMAGAQDQPHVAYFAALNGGLRYHFRTGTPLVPFIGGTVGVGLTDIEDADATGKFQFNQTIGTGVRYFLDERTAVTLDYAYWHVSNAGIKEPNDGVNAHIVSLGLAWLF